MSESQIWDEFGMYSFRLGKKWYWCCQKIQNFQLELIFSGNLFSWEKFGKTTARMLSSKDFKSQI